MPANRNALIRYTTIDKCLQNKHRTWTLEDLIEACSDALYEFEGIDKGVSKRTIQADIQTMRSEKLGYNAPIIVIDKKFYAYEDSKFSIRNIPVTDQDLDHLNEAVSILKQFKGFSQFQELDGIVHRLQDKIQSTRKGSRSIMDFEKNDQLKGLEFIDPLYKIIQNKSKVLITYQSFKARSKNTFEFHPFLLKEHRNRWFLLGKKHASKPHVLLALDRIINVEDLQTTCISFDETKIQSYFSNVIGVTVNEGKEPEEIIFMAPHSNAPYISTKPFHKSQNVIETNDEGVFFSIFVQHNFELERDLLSQGERIKVISPPRLRNIIKERLMHAHDNYQTDLNIRTLKNYKNILQNKGSIVTNHIYSKKTISAITHQIEQYYKKSETKNNTSVYAIRRLFKEIPELKTLCINPNLKKIIDSFGDSYFLSKAIYFDKPAKSNWFVTWHQDLTINVEMKIETNGYQGWTTKNETISVIPPISILENTITIRIHLDDTDEKNGALNVILGSHKKIHIDQEIQTITSNAIAKTIQVIKGGIHIMTPLLLHSSSKTINQKNRRVIHLEFNNQKLDNGIEWAEKELIS